MSVKIDLNGTINEWLALIERLKAICEEFGKTLDEVFIFRLAFLQQ